MSEKPGFQTWTENRLGDGADVVSSGRVFLTRTVAILEKIFGGLALTIWEATAAKLNYYRTN